MCGVINDWELGVAAQSVWHDPEYDSSFDRLLDATLCDSSPVAPSFIEAVAADRTARRTGRVAYIGKAAQLERFHKHFVPHAGVGECRGFLTREEALAWLGIPAC